MGVPTKKTGIILQQDKEVHAKKKKKMSTVETHELEWVSAKKDMT